MKRENFILSFFLILFVSVYQTFLILYEKGLGQKKNVQAIDIAKGTDLLFHQAQQNYFRY